MITIAGKKYAKNPKEFTASLFDSSGTCVGFYRVKKNGILLSDMQGIPFAFCVNNEYGEKFLVSCSNIEGKIRYMYGLSESDCEKLGIEKRRYSEQRFVAESIVEAIKAIKARSLK